jgi:CRP-like cAMP-binding protein
MTTTTAPTSPMHDLLAGLSPRERDRVSQLFTSITVEPGRVLTREGTVGREAMYIERGTAQVERRGTAVTCVRDGDFVGEIALLTGAPRTATVTARTDMVVSVLGAAEFATLLSTSPTIARRILVGAMHRLGGSPTS